MKAVLSIAFVFAALILATPGGAQGIPENLLDQKAAQMFHEDPARTLPILFLVGDLSVHDPNPGEAGWGDVIAKYFDSRKIIVENRAVKGCSTRTFQTGGHWDSLLAAARPGDFVLVEMGHNENEPLDDTNRACGTLRGIGEETREVYLPLSGRWETVHTYGWYLRKYISDARQRGITPIICSPTPAHPRNEAKAAPTGLKVYARFAAAVAHDSGAPFIDLNKIILSHFETMSASNVRMMYFVPHYATRTTLEGAELNASSVVEGLRQLTNCPLAGYLSPSAR